MVLWESSVIVVACGSRTWTDVQIIRRRISALKRTDIVIHGDAIGADTIIHACAIQRGLFVGRFTVEQAHYDLYGRTAPLSRNAAMAALKPSLVIAFRVDGKSNGTDNMVHAALTVRKRMEQPLSIEVWKENGTKENK